MLRVVVESPYAGNVERNVTYARAALAHCLARGEAPFASHLLYTQPGVLDDSDPAQRGLGIEAGFALWSTFHLIAFYADLGMSTGMKAAHERAQRLGYPIEVRFIGEAPDAPMVQKRGIIYFTPPAI